MILSVLRWARAHRRPVLAAAGVAALFSLLAVRSLTFDADVLHLLPRQGRAVPAFEQFLQRFGTLDHLYVVFEAPAGHTIDEYADRIAAFVARLEDLPEIERVDAGLFGEGRDWHYLADRALLVLSPDRAQTALDRFTPAQLPAQIAGARELLSLPSPEIAAMVRQDPLGLFPLLRDQLQGAAASLTIDPSRGGYVTRDGRSQLVLARPTRPPFDIDFSKQLFARLEALERDARTDGAVAGSAVAGTAAEETRAPASPPGPGRPGQRPAGGAAPDAARGAGRGATPPADAQAAGDTQSDDEAPLPALGIAFAGGHRISLETEREVRRETVWNSVGSLAVILPLLFLAFRSPWLVAVGPLPSALAIAMVLAIYAVAGVTLSAAATGAAAMLFGLGIDGVVLMFVAFRQQIGEGRSADDAVQALGGSASSMLLGMWTTAATFYGLTVIDFPSLQELGALIGHGMVLCGLLTWILVPALFPRRVRRRVPPLTAWWLARFVTAHAGAILVAAVIVTAALGLAATRVRVDASLDKLRSTTAAADLERQIAARFGLPRDVLIALARGPDLEALLADNERLVETLAHARPSLMVYAPSSLLPSQARQARAAARIEAAALGPAEVAPRLLDAARAAGFKEDTFAPFLEHLPRLLDSRARLTFDGFKAQGLDEVLGRTVTRAADGYAIATYLYPTSEADEQAIRTAIASFGNPPEPGSPGGPGGPGVPSRAGAGSAGDRGGPGGSGGSGGPGDRMTLTGLPEVNRELAARFTPEFLKGLGLGTALVIGLMIASFRRLDLTLLALVPTVLALVWAGGLLALARIELDLFSVFAVMTFVGIGVDYGIHMVHRVQHATETDTPAAIAQLAPVILVAGGITFLGFGTLVTSSYAPLRSLGVISTVMVITLMFSSLLVLPALLVRRRRA